MTDCCIEWPGSRTTAGYGRIGNLYAHRFIWEITNGPIPNGFHVLHRCDNPPCVNPRHLFIGTPNDNSRDKIAKGRANDHLKPRPGSFNGNAKLSNEQVREIRRRVNIGRQGANGRYRGNARELAAEFNVSESLIYLIAQRKAWSHL